jgi:hypothetical protein
VKNLAFIFLPTHKIGEKGFYKYLFKSAFRIVFGKSSCIVADLLAFGGMVVSFQFHLSVCPAELAWAMACAK